MIRCLHSWENISLSTVNPNGSEQPTSLEKKTPAPSDARPPNVPAPDILVLALTPTQYTKEDLQKITKL